MRAALAEMRTLLFELRPAALETAPLDGLLERLGDALGGQTQVDVDVEVDKALDLPPDVKIVFYRVTQEAFSNIAKHARAEHVSARVLAVDGVATLTVQDDGRGFDPAAVPSGGHMGLRIMSERLERIAGTLTVESVARRGHDHPRRVAVDCFGRAPTGENGSVTDTDDIRVLIVDDHQMVREGLKVLLSTYADIEVVGEAANGLEALDQCGLVDPDVVLMDVQMPVMDGPEATAEIGLTCPDVRVIALTSFIDQESVEKALDAGRDQLPAQGRAPGGAHAGDQGRRRRPRHHRQQRGARCSWSATRTRWATT